MKIINKNTFTLFILIFFSFNLFSQIVEKVEPPFWWSGMKNPDLQILIYGESISTYDIDIDKEDLLKSIETTENENYVFLNIHIPVKICWLDL